MSGGWVSALEPAHATRGRVRWRYACRPGAPSDPHTLERAVATVDGVRKQRKVSRSVGRHGFEDAWYEVAAIVSAKVGLAVEAPPKGLLCAL